MALLDFTSLLAPGLPPPAAKWTGFAKYNFIGGHNDSDQLPLDVLIKAANDVLTREGRTLATYGLSSGPLGYRRLREFLAQKLERSAGIRCDADEILITSGSLQALDLVNGVLLARGDTVIIEQATYQGALTRLQRLGVEAVGIPLDADGMRMDVLAAALDALQRRGVRPKYIYTIPTVQNPTGTILSEARRHEMLRLAAQHGVPIFEDDCYSDLIWDGKRLPALYAMSRHGGVRSPNRSRRLCASATSSHPGRCWRASSRSRPMPAQVRWSRWCSANSARRISTPMCRRSPRALRAKLETLMDALQFGTAAEFDDPKGGIFLWVKLPDQSTLKGCSHRRLAPASPSIPAPSGRPTRTTARAVRACVFPTPRMRQFAGVVALRQLCGAEFGVPSRIANVQWAKA
jgi:2-aminoadipate transaminase